METFTVIISSVFLIWWSCAQDRHEAPRQDRRREALQTMWAVFS